MASAVPASPAQSAPARTTDKLLQRPLYVFDLPEELLYSLQLRLQSTTNPPSAPPPSTSPRAEGNGHVPAPSSEKPEGSASTATSCALCGLTFPDLQEQRRHVRSDLHGYNLKQKLRNRKTVTEVEFERLVGDLDDSISGSDSSDSDDAEDDGLGGTKSKETTLSALLKRQARVNDGDADDAPTKARQAGAGKAPLIYFTSPKLPSTTSLGVYRSIFTTAEQDHEESLIETIKRKQLAPRPAPTAPKVKPQDDEGGVPLNTPPVTNFVAPPGPYYFLCMIGGGHFAAMLVSLTPKLTKKFGVEDRSATVIAHKTFHRYTTRRKQGGSQSANDNAKGNAHSAGSTIRRHNEVALIDEIRALLAGWKPWIDGAELLFIRASGSTNRRTLFGPYEDQVLNLKDERIRGFPFSTRRATQSELMRSFIELTRVKVNIIDEVALAKQAEEAAAAASKSEKPFHQASTTTKPPKPSKVDEEATLHTTQLQALIRRSKAPALLSYLQSNSLSPDFRFFPPNLNRTTSTPLHLAASTNSAVCISALLTKANADPSVQNADGKYPFDLTHDRPTRDAFRLARGVLGEKKWSWDAAHVPPALSRADADARTAKEKAEKAAEEQAEKQRRATELERLRKEDVEREKERGETRLGKGRVLIEKPKLTAEERRAEDARGMSEEMRMKLEREKRARAAEERMRRLQGT